MPGVAYREPLIDGAPGHGEGHNSGQAVNIVAALAVKEIMQRERLPGTIVIWPGVAEELLAAKAWFVRDGRFDGVDAVLFTHVGARFGTAGATSTAPASCPSSTRSRERPRTAPWCRGAAAARSTPSSS